MCNAKVELEGGSGGDSARGSFKAANIQSIEAPLQKLRQVNEKAVRAQRARGPKVPNGA